MGGVVFPMSAGILDDSTGIAKLLGIAVNKQIDVGTLVGARVLGVICRAIEARHISDLGGSGGQREFGFQFKFRFNRFFKFF